MSLNVGTRRSRVFFEEGDYALYLDLLSEAALKAETEIWCYCLMPNHVHLIAVPFDKDGLRETFADAHRRYTGYINARLRRSQGPLGNAARSSASRSTRHGEAELPASSFPS